MGKNKLRRFAENETFENVIQPKFQEIFETTYKWSGKWGKEFFKNENPIVLELGCGKGEYSVGLARKFTEKNFMGVDIKGARMWRGAKTAIEEGMKNVGFLRTQIELIKSFFAKNEVSEIWITFPDPQLKKRRHKKRLTSSRFLNNYRNFLKEDGIVHLKTDSYELYEYTRELIAYNNLEVLVDTDDLYNSGKADDILSIRTFYEGQYLEQGKKITYLKFKPGHGKDIVEVPEEE